MFDDYMLVKVLNKIKEIISIERYDNAKISIETDDKLAYCIILKNVVASVACIIKDDGKFYPQLFLEEVLVEQN